MSKKVSILKNVEEVRNSLLENYSMLRNGRMDISTSKELSNVAGKVLSMATRQLEYNKYMKNKQPINFFEV